MSGDIRILVVDDDEATLGMIAVFLRRHGYEVLTAASPGRGLDLLRAQPVHLVITDWMMPQVDGIGFTEQIHALPGQAEVPVILMTAFDGPGLADQGMRRGVALTLAKPLELNRLLDLVGFATAPAPPP
jgi:two-component system, chemotaxis family, chemotaxis protein CheY